MILGAGHDSEAGGGHAINSLVQVLRCRRHACSLSREATLPRVLGVLRHIDWLATPMQPLVSCI